MPIRNGKAIGGDHPTTLTSGEKLALFGASGMITKAVPLYAQTKSNPKKKKPKSNRVSNSLPRQHTRKEKKTHEVVGMV